MWDDVVHVGWCVLHSRSNGGEGGGEVGQSRRERCAGVSDGKGDEFDLSTVSLEGRDEGRVFLDLGLQLGVGA